LLDLRRENRVDAFDEGQRRLVRDG
jgi:hypothetical protein